MLRTTTCLVPRLGCAGIHADVSLLTMLRENAGDDTGALYGLRLRPLNES